MGGKPNLSVVHEASGGLCACWAPGWLTAHDMLNAALLYLQYKEEEEAQLPQERVEGQPPAATSDTDDERDQGGAAALAVEKVLLKQPSMMP